MQAVSDIASHTGSIDHTISNITSRADIIGLASIAVTEGTSDARVAEGRSGESRHAGRAETVEAATLAVGDQAEGLAGIIDELVSSKAGLAGIGSTACDTVCHSAVGHTGTVGEGIISSDACADGSRGVGGSRGSGACGAAAGAIGKDEVGIAGLTEVG